MHSITILTTVTDAYNPATNIDLFLKYGLMECIISESCISEAGFFDKSFNIMSENKATSEFIKTNVAAFIYYSLYFIQDQSVSKCIHHR